MLKGQDLYWIYEQRPEEERTNDGYFKSCAACQADYINLRAKHLGMMVTLKPDYRDLYSYVFCIAYKHGKTEYATVYKNRKREWIADLHYGGWVTKQELGLVMQILQAIEQMEEKI